MTRMSHPDGSPPKRRSYARVPLRAKFRMEFEARRFFLSEQAFNICPDGAFVRTVDLMPVGETLLFESDLTRRGPRICGQAEVMWLREEIEGASRPIGMGIKFTEIEEDGAALLEELAELYLAAGVESMNARLEELADEWQQQHLEDDSTASLRFDDRDLPETEPLKPITEDEIDGQDSLEDDPTLPMAPIDVDQQVTQPMAPISDDEVDTGLSAEGDEPAGDPEDLDLPAPSPVDGVIEELEEDAEDESLMAGGDEVDSGEDEEGSEPADSGDEVETRGRFWIFGILAILGGVTFAVMQSGSLGSDREENPPAAKRVADTVANAVTLDGGGDDASGLGAMAEEVSPGSLVSFRAIEAIDWNESDSGLMVKIRVDGYLPPGSYEHYRLGGESPREVIQLFGVGEEFSEHVMTVDSPLVDRIRTGFHRRDGGRDEVRIVFDLAHAGASITSIETDGTVLHVLVSVPDIELLSSSGSGP